MEEENKSAQQEPAVDPVKLVKRVRKSRKVRQGRRKQSVTRRTVRFLMTVVLIFLFVYISKMPHWYLPQNAYTAPNNTIKIENNRIVKTYRIFSILKRNKVPHVPIYMMKTNDIEKEIRTLKPVEDVYVRRYAFPARLNIIIKERIPVISVCVDEKSTAVGAYTQDGILIGRDFMPIPTDIKTVKVLALANGDFSYTKWTKDDIDKILSLVNYIETYSTESVEYIDMRNPSDVFVKVKTVKIRIGKLDGTVYERIQRIPSIIPQIKLMRSKVQYLDISWEKVNYLKLYK